MTRETTAFIISLLVVIALVTVFLSNTKYWLIFVFVLILGLGICVYEFIIAE